MQGSHCFVSWTSEGIPTGEFLSRFQSFNPTTRGQVLEIVPLRPYLPSSRRDQTNRRWSAWSIPTLFPPPSFRAGEPKRQQEFATARVAPRRMEPSSHSLLLLSPDLGCALPGLISPGHLPPSWSLPVTMPAVSPAGADDRGISHPFLPRGFRMYFFCVSICTDVQPCSPS